MNRPTRNKAIKTVQSILPFLYICIGLFIGIKIAVYILPFILAYALSSMMEPLVRFLQNKFNLSRKLSAAASILLIFTLLISIAAFALFRLVREMMEITNTLPRIVADIHRNMDAFIEKVTEIYTQLPSGLAKNVELLLSTGSEKLNHLLRSSLNYIFGIAASIPQMVVFIVVTVLSTYFFISDKEKLTRNFRAILPAKLVNSLNGIRKQILGALIAYMKAQLILMTITFIELFIGFLLIRVGSPFLLALLISLIDALPVLGTGSVLVPWLLYGFLTGNARLGLSLMILYLIVLLVRQMVEPKVVSHQLGIHPIFTLMAMYAGLKLFGVLGMILGPMAVLVLYGLFRDAFLKAGWKSS